MLRLCLLGSIVAGLFAGFSEAATLPVNQTALYQRIKRHLNAVRAIDTHDHLFPFDKLRARVETAAGPQVNLAGLWLNSYAAMQLALPPWQAGETFDTWWPRAKPAFDNGRALSVYRYLLPAFADLYGVDFDRITDEQARELSGRVVGNYQTEQWTYEVVTRRANIELMFIDAYWARFDFKTDYRFAVQVVNINSLVDGFHPSEFKTDADSPYAFARKRGLKLKTFDDYLHALAALVQEAKQHGVACLKCTLAYLRPLAFANVPAGRAAQAFGKPRSELTADEVRDFEDSVMWRLAELCARYQLPFQIHTGWGRIQGSNPMLLVDLIEGNPKTQFILFHGGFPWTGESAVIAMRHKNVRLDSNWLPTLSFSTARQAYHQWLETVPSNKIMWGGDCNNAEGIYGAAEMTRRCLAEVLAEKVERGSLQEEQALRIGRQILRENALEMFPQLKARVQTKDAENSGR